MGIPAVIAAGDGKAAKAVYGESKVYLEIDGRTLVARTVAALQLVPQISEVWVVGNAERLEALLGQADLRAELRKPLHVVSQFRNLYENVWQAFRRTLPGAPPEGRDPAPGDLDARVLYISGDLPLATPQEISQFIERSLARGCDYAVGLVTEQSLRDFYPRARGEPGVRMAYFNLREGRLRQSNLHLVRPARIASRNYIEEMYEHRHQREIGDIVGLAWRLLRSERGGLRLVAYYGLMQLASVADRWRLRWLADRVRRWIPIAKVEGALSSLLGTSLGFVVTDIGGCALDIDNEPDYDAVRSMFGEWSKAQQARAERIYGALPASASADPPGVGGERE